MKRKISFLVILGLSSSLTLALAATADPCADKFKACTDSALNAFSQCKARGVAVDTCERNRDAEKANCQKAKKKCDEEKGGNKSTTAPKKADPKKTQAATTKTDANKKK